LFDVFGAGDEVVLFEKGVVDGEGVLAQDHHKGGDVLMPPLCILVDMFVEVCDVIYEDA
jgi:hypothetical protein